MQAAEFIVDKAFGATGLIVLGFFMKYYFDNVHQRITDIQATNEAKFNDIVGRITSIESKYRDVLDIVLEKFSKWEDRILGIISKMGEVSPKELQVEVDKFREEARNDIQTMRLRVERVQSEVQKIVAEPIDESSKKLLIGRVEELRGELQNRTKYLEDNIAKLAKVMNIVHSTQKEHEFKIGNLIATRPQIPRKE